VEEKESIKNNSPVDEEEDISRPYIMGNSFPGNVLCMA